MDGLAGAAEEPPPLTEEQVEWKKDEREKALYKGCLTFLMLLLYAGMCWIYNGGMAAESLAGIKQEWQDEVTPSVNKMTERVLEGEAGLELDHTMVIDDVTQIMAMIQKFCATMNGINKHLRWSYACRSMHTMIEWPDVSDDTMKNDPGLPNGMNCDRKAIEKALVDGDNPFEVPFGQLPVYLQEHTKGLAPEVQSTLSIFDEQNALAFQPNLFQMMQNNFLLLSESKELRSMTNRAMKGGSRRGGGLVEEAAEAARPEPAGGRAARVDEETTKRTPRSERPANPTANHTLFAVDAQGAATPQLAEARPASLAEDAAERVDIARERAALARERRELEQLRQGKPAPKKRPWPAQAALLEAQKAKYLSGSGGPPPGSTNLPILSSADKAGREGEEHLQKQQENLKKTIEADAYLERIAAALPPECYSLNEDAVKENKTEYIVRKLCRNHHWGMLTACQPLFFEVQYRVTFLHKRSELKHDPIPIGGHFSNGSAVEVLVYDRYETDPHLFLDYKIGFTALGHADDGVASKGIYEVTYTTSQGEFPGEKAAFEFWYCLLFVIFAIYVYHQELLALFLFPANFAKLVVQRTQVTTRADAADLVLSLVDPRQSMRAYVSLSGMILGLAIAFCMFLGWLASFISFFYDVEVMVAPIWTPSSTWCQMNQHTFYQYVVKCLPTLPQTTTFTIPAELLCNSLYGPHGIEFHKAACFIVFLRALTIFNCFERTAWVGRTVDRAISEGLSFLLVLLAVVLGSAFFLFIIFGSSFVQFQDFNDSIIAIALFTFGIADQAMHEVDGVWWNQSRALLLSLLVYSIVVIAFGMNVMVTIVIDAYYAAKKDPWVDCWTANDQRVAYLFFLFPNVPQEETKEERKEQETKRRRGPPTVSSQPTGVSQTGPADQPPAPS